MKGERRKVINLKTIVAATLAFAGIGILAQGASAQSINQREHRQHERVVNGVRHHELNGRERAEIRRREARIRRMEFRDRRSGHRLTWAERMRIQRAENRASRDIYRKKHNGWHRG